MDAKADNEAIKARLDPDSTLHWQAEGGELPLGQGLRQAREDFEGVRSYAVRFLNAAHAYLTSEPSSDVRSFVERFRAQRPDEADRVKQEQAMASFGRIDWGLVADLAAVSDEIRDQLSADQVWQRLAVSALQTEETRQVVAALDQLRSQLMTGVDPQHSARHRGLLHAVYRVAALTTIGALIGAPLGALGAGDPVLKEMVKCAITGLVGGVAVEAVGLKFRGEAPPDAYETAERAKRDLQDALLKYDSEVTHHGKGDVYAVCNARIRLENHMCTARQSLVDISWGRSKEFYDVLDDLSAHLQDKPTTSHEALVHTWDRLNAFTITASRVREGDSIDVTPRTVDAVGMIRHIPGGGLPAGHGDDNRDQATSANVTGSLDDAADVVDRAVAEVAQLLRERNTLDHRLARITNRPMTSGYLGEWLAAKIFDIELEPSAVTQGIDGRFRSAPLEGCTVNVKWYLKREGLLDTTDCPELDYYLVLAGPPGSATSSQAGTRPWCIDAVYLFDAHQLRAQQTARGVKQGVASSIVRQQWNDAQIYPADTPHFPLTPRQRDLLRLLHQDTVAPRVDH